LKNEGLTLPFLSFIQTIDVPTMPFVTERKVLSNEPAANWNSVEYYMPLNSTTEPPATSFDEGGYDGSFRKTGETPSLLSSSIRAMGFSEDLLEMVRHTERPDEMHSIHDLELNAVSQTGISGLETFHYFLLSSVLTMIPSSTSSLKIDFHAFSGNAPFSTQKQNLLDVHGTSGGLRSRQKISRRCPTVKILRSTK
jgi:hypothetical protein